MLRILWLNLQLFGEGGDGGDGGSSSATGEAVGGNSGEDLIPASVPEKARKYYQKAMEKNAPAKPAENPQPTNEEIKTETKLSYSDLIKSDDYRDEHKAYMEKTIGDRLKKYKGLEDDYGKAKNTLAVVASKYGLNPEDEGFLDALNQKIEEDNSYYEKYAMENDVSLEEARKVVTMERKLAQSEAEKQAQIRAQEEAKKQAQMQQQVALLRQNAERTKAQFPQFDIDKEIQDEKFRRLCAVNNGDTTSAYMACHWNEIIPATVQMASKQVQEQTAQTIASNQSRPIEGGLTSSAPSVTQTNFKGMSLQEIRAYADEQRRKNGR